MPILHPNHATVCPYLTNPLKMCVLLLVKQTAGGKTHVTCAAVGVKGYFFSPSPPSSCSLPTSSTIQGHKQVATVASYVIKVFQIYCLNKKEANVRRHMSRCPASTRLQLKIIGSRTRLLPKVHICIMT